MSLKTVLTVSALPLLLAACSKDMYSGKSAQKGMEAIKAKLGYPDPLFSRIEIKKDEIMAYGQHPKNPEALTQVFYNLSLIHISEPTRLLSISYAVFCLKKKKKKNY